MPRAQTERRRLLEKLLGELVRSEGLAIEHPPRAARRIGEAAPVLVLRDVAVHALAMRGRFQRVVEGHNLIASPGIVARLSRLRDHLADRLRDRERAYRAALLELRRGLDVVRVLREVARLEELFAVIRWCDDWLPARRTLVTRVEAQLVWFADRVPDAPTPSHDATPGDPSEAEHDDPSVRLDGPHA